MERIGERGGSVWGSVGGSVGGVGGRLQAKDIRTTAEERGRFGIWREASGQLCECGYGGDLIGQRLGNAGEFGGAGGTRVSTARPGPVTLLLAESAAGSGCWLNIGADASFSSRPRFIPALARKTPMTIPDSLAAAVSETCVLRGSEPPAHQVPEAIREMTFQRGLVRGQRQCNIACRACVRNR